MTDKLLVTHQDGIASLTLNMPEQRNPITDADVVDDICAAMDSIRIARTNKQH